MPTANKALSDAQLIDSTFTLGADLGKKINDKILDLVSENTDLINQRIDPSTDFLIGLFGQFYMLYTIATRQVSEMSGHLTLIQLLRDHAQKGENVPHPVELAKELIGVYKGDQQKIDDNLLFALIAIYVMSTADHFQVAETLRKAGLAVPHVKRLLEDLK